MTVAHPPGHLAERICAWGTDSPDKVAIDDYGDVWTYRRLAGEIDRWAGRLQQRGLRAGDTVLLFLPQTAEAIAAYFGVMRCGAVPSFMPLPSPKQDPGYYWHSHANLLRLIQPAALVTLEAPLAAMRSAGFADIVPMLLAADGAWTEVAPWTGPSPGAADDIALLQHSSGTTALKKGVQLSHGAIARQVASYAHALQASADDVVVSWLPMYHDMGLIACTVTPLLLGQTVVLLDPFKWVSEPVSLLHAIHRHRGTLTWLPNFAFELLAKTVRFEPGSLDLSSMRAFINCSEPCKAATFDRFLAKFAPTGVRAEALQVCYAMAETVFAVSQTDIGRPVPRLNVDAQRLSEEKRVAAPRDAGAAVELLSAGRAIDGMRVTIVDADGQALPADHVGEIELSSEFLFDGYLNRPEITAQKLRAGRYRTNDMGFVHGDQVFVLGRADDLLIVHGRNYFAHEVEAVVNDVAGLKAGRNVAVAVFNEMLGSQDVVVIAELAPGAPAPADKGLELKRAVKHAVAESMGLDLRDVRIVEAGWLAKTTSGKISRSLNRDKYLQDLAAARRH
ncbi:MULTISPECIES: AMP-binding protein [unclassified Methylibium]|uniref:AMP-binding protein n=1 Tax=unclassified Methylibium TaxID=2633235 RepID=UPI0003F42293|nr:MULTISPECIES: AMP-binding protein [unclassified Methylibium]EWS56191.1 putative ligase [Methylibium sp. T29]EWS61158.1 putative ligase [Methylibium sp. T29-B]